MFIFPPPYKIRKYLGDIPEKKYIRSILDIEDGKYGFINQCFYTGLTQFIIVEENHLQVTEVKDIRVIFVSVICEQCDLTHDYILWREKIK